jgi:hypothetical protein
VTPVLALTVALLLMLAEHRRSLAQNIGVRHRPCND